MLPSTSGNCTSMFLPQDRRLEKPEPNLMTPPLDLYFSIGTWVMDSVQSMPSDRLSDSLFSYINASNDVSSNDFSHKQEHFTQNAQSQAGSIIIITIGVILACLPLAWILNRLVLRKRCRKSEQKSSIGYASTYFVWCQVIAYFLVIFMALFGIITYFLIIFNNPKEFKNIFSQTEIDVQQVDSTGDNLIQCAFDAYISQTFSEAKSNFSSEPDVIGNIFAEMSGLKYINIVGYTAIAYNKTEAQLLLESLAYLEQYANQLTEELSYLLDHSTGCANGKEVIDNDIYIINVTMGALETLQNILPTIISDLNNTMSIGTKERQILEDSIHTCVVEQSSRFNQTQDKLWNITSETIEIAENLNHWSWLIASSLQNSISSDNSSKASAGSVICLVFLTIAVLSTVTVSLLSIVFLIWRKTERVQNCLRFRKSRVMACVPYAMAICTTIILILAMRLLKILPSSRSMFNGLEQAILPLSMISFDEVLADLYNNATEASIFQVIQNANLTIGFNITDANAYDKAANQLKACSNILVSKEDHQGFILNCTVTDHEDKIDNLLRELRDFTAAIYGAASAAERLNSVVQLLVQFDSNTTRSYFTTSAQSQVQQVFEAQESFINQSITTYQYQLENTLYNPRGVFLNYVNPIFTYCHQYRPIDSSIWLLEGLIEFSMILAQIIQRLTKQVMKSEEEYLRSPSSRSELPRTPSAPCEDDGEDSASHVSSSEILNVTTVEPELTLPYPSIANPMPRTRPRFFSVT